MFTEPFSRPLSAEARQRLADAQKMFVLAKTSKSTGPHLAQFEAQQAHRARVIKAASDLVDRIYGRGT